MNTLTSTAVTAIVINLLGICVAGAGEVASRFATVDGLRIHYLEAGSGSAVVLIHGLHSSAQINWRMPGIVDELAKRHRVVALDMPGHGLSDKPDDEQKYGLAVVEDIVGLMDQLKIDKAHLVGYSLGGMVTVKLLVAHPQRVTSAVIGGMGWLKEGSRLQQLWEQMPAREASRTPAAFLHGVGKLAVSAEQLQGIHLPVEIVVGDRDPVRRLYVAPLAGVRQDWPVVEIAGAGHLNCIVKPEFREEIVSWVSKHDRP